LCKFDRTRALPERTSRMTTAAKSIQIVYIGASWCSTCKTIGPATETLCKKFGIDLKKLDYDTDLEGDEQDSIQKVPTLRAFVEGQQVAEWNQNQVASLEAWLSHNVSVTTTDDF
jgi:thioredoxin-like negative regulator of GroEL